MATAETATTEEPIPKRSDERKFIRNWAFLRMAHEALMVNRVADNAKHTQRLANFAATGDKQQLLADATEASDDMAGISIGNEVHNHYQGAPQTETTQATVSQAGGGTLGKMLLGAALLAGGAGAGAFAVNALDQDKPPAAADTDTDTTLEVTFPK